MIANISVEEVVVDKMERCRPAVGGSWLLLGFDFGFSIFELDAIL
jgi:hypothetical protein